MPTALVRVGSHGAQNLTVSGPRYTGRTMLQVESDVDGFFYLRGASAGAYTGQSWQAGRVLRMAAARRPRPSPTLRALRAARRATPCSCARWGTAPAFATCPCTPRACSRRNLRAIFTRASPANRRRWPLWHSRAAARLWRCRRKSKPMPPRCVRCIRPCRKKRAVPCWRWLRRRASGPGQGPKRWRARWKPM